MSDPHAGVQELLGYARGELDRDTADRVRAHCFECIDCGDQLAALVLLRRASNEAGVVDRSPRRRGLAAAAALVVLVGLTAWTLWPSGNDAEVGVAIETPAAADSSLTAPAEPASMLPYPERALARVLGRSAERMGGDAAAVSVGAVAADSAAVLVAAGVALQASDFAAVVGVLEEAEEDSAVGRAMLGIALYGLGDRARARSVLQSAASAAIERVADATDWRLDEELAVVLLARIYAGDGHRAEAVALLERMADPAGRVAAQHAAAFLAELNAQ